MTTSNRISRAFAYLYGALLFGGATVGIVAILHAFAQYAGERDGAWQTRSWQVTSFGGARRGLLLLTFGYGLVYWKKGSNWLAAPLYILSFLMLGATIYLIGVTLGKEAYADDIAYTVIVGLPFILPALAVAADGLFWNYRNSRWT